MKILMLGSWQKEKAIASKTEAEEIGKILAKKGHIIISGGGRRSFGIGCQLLQKK